MHFDTLGLSGPVVTSNAPIVQDLSVDSIVAALEAASAIRSNIYDADGVIVVPVVFAVKRQLRTHAGWAPPASEPP